MTNMFHVTLSIVCHSSEMLEAIVETKTKFFSKKTQIYTEIHEIGRMTMRHIHPVQSSVTANEKYIYLSNEHTGKFKRTEKRRKE